MNLKLNYEGFEDNLYSVYICKSESEYEFVFQKNECVMNVIIINNQYTRRLGDGLWGVKLGWSNAMNTAEFLEEVDYDFANQNINGYNYCLTNEDVIHILDTVKNS